MKKLGCRAVVAVVIILLPFSASAQGYETYVSPGYFGPGTFQVPQMNDGARTSGSFQALLTGDFVLGHTGTKDHTADIYFEFKAPLFTDRVNFSIWGVLHEWYDQSLDVLEYRKATKLDKPKGDNVGVIFVSTDVQIVKEKKWCPAILARVGLRSASEDGTFENRRGYDSPGYFADLAVGKTFGPVAVSASAGFLCWQVKQARQNDAIMFGAKINYEHEYVRAGLQYGGYWGWRRDGDFPRVLYLHADFGPRKWYVKPYILYQHGFHDWPFDMFRVGIKADVDVFALVKKHRQ